MLFSYISIRDVESDWLYPDPQNLMNSDTDLDPVRILVNKITDLISKNLFKVKKLLIFKSEPKPYIEISFHQENVGDDVPRFRLEKYYFL